MPKNMGCLRSGFTIHVPATPLLTDQAGIRFHRQRETALFTFTTHYNLCNFPQQLADLQR
jgi:hypothetical protein